MDAAAEIGKNPVSMHGDEQADAGRDCRTRLLARPANSQARTGTGNNINFPCSADHDEQDWQPYPVDPY